MIPLKHTQKENFCLISIEATGIWHDGIISSVDLNKKRLEVFLQDRHMDKNYTPAAKVTVKSKNDENGFLIEGTIIRTVRTIRKRAIIIEINKTLNFLNYRKNERFYVNFPALIKSDNVMAKGTVTDISLGGIQFSCSSPIAEKTASLDIEISKADILHLKGTITRSTNVKAGYIYGLMLNDKSKEDSMMLEELIGCLTIEKEKTAQEWMVFKRIKYAIYLLTILAVFFIIFVILATEGV